MCFERFFHSTHRHAASTNPAHPVSVPIRHPSDSHKLRDRHIYIANATRYQVHTRYILMRVGSGLFPWSVAAGLLAFSSRQCLHLQSIINLCPLSHYFSFLSKRSGRRTPPAERSALYTVYKHTLCTEPINGIDSTCKHTVCT